MSATMTIDNSGWLARKPCGLHNICDDDKHFVGPRRKVGRPCEDCGRTLPVRVIFFRATGLRMTVCAACERPYVHLSTPEIG